jgi:CRP/FNR family transcriptional regulator, nitrogen fixation regulation protein
MLVEAASLSDPTVHPLGRTGQRRYPPPGTAGLAGARLSFNRNSEIYGEGEPAAHLYQVISGIVRTCRFLIDGRRQIGSFYLPGDTFGLETTAEYTFSAEAVTDVNVLVVKRGILPSQLWELMGSELRRTQDHVLLLAKTAPERVATFLLEMARRVRSRDEVELSMSRQDIADYLGLTIETVSRTLTQLENESAIALPTSKRIVLRDRATLKRLNS